MNIRHEKVYEQLAAIAPTVMIDDDISYVNWRGRFKQLGQWFDKEAAVENGLPTTMPKLRSLRRESGI